VWLVNGCTGLTLNQLAPEINAFARPWADGRNNKSVETESQFWLILGDDGFIAGKE
jgi:hypothetical protein